MASRLRSIARPVSNFIKSSINTPKPSSASSFSSSQLPRSSPAFSRCRSERACVLQSLLPLHSAVSTARLTSCLGVDSRNSSSLSQGTLCRANPGV
ncbi:hypothetical protein Scep_008080 [Stephania cephalantha]|uniref:Uncharacterized protein n=1 Tax=Stephania cephalantha TaxID=152367 RepID=A0AAP0KB04_9MAGN